MAKEERGSLSLILAFYSFSRSNYYDIRDNVWYGYICYMCYVCSYALVPTGSRKYVICICEIHKRMSKRNHLHTTPRIHEGEKKNNKICSQSIS